MARWVRFDETEVLNMDNATYVKMSKNEDGTYDVTVGSVDRTASTRNLQSKSTAEMFVATLTGPQH